MHTQPLTITTDTAVASSTTTSRTALRTGSTLLLGGLVPEYVVTSFHAAHENPNDHHAVFAESRALPRWSAPIALLAGLAFIADGIVVGTNGFTGSVPNLVAWASFILFAAIATIAAWRRRTNHQPTEQPRPTQNRLSHN